MSLDSINPESLGTPKGYSNGVLCRPGGRLLFVAGQIGWDSKQQFASDGFVDQFDQALANVLAVVAEAGGAPTDIARVLIYVTDKEEYRSRTAEVGQRWRARMGKHYPAMALIEVKGLLEDTAKVEIEAIAVIY
jgi:enamine deaminase RidA (YjgF/YER057c/UK114 family)